MTELRLAEGEEVVRQYGCTAVDNCAVFAGTVIPLRSKRKRESNGTITVTNRRVIYDMEVAGSGKRRPSSIHQETRIEDISSISTMMGKFGRDLRVPILLIVIGFILIFAPFVYVTETGAFETGGDYEAGYNHGVERGYYNTYIKAISAGDVDNTIPPGYSIHDEQFTSSDYDRGFYAGLSAGINRAEADIAADRDFNVPSDLMIHSIASIAVIITAVIGAVVFILGSVVFAISGRTKDWISVRFGSGGDSGVFITSLSGGISRSGVGPVIGEQDSVSMMSEIGSVITSIRSQQTSYAHVGGGIE